MTISVKKRCSQCLIYWKTGIINASDQSLPLLLETSNVKPERDWVTDVSPPTFTEHQNNTQTLMQMTLLQLLGKRAVKETNPLISYLQNNGLFALASEIWSSHTERELSLSWSRGDCCWTGTASAGVLSFCCQQPFLAFVQQERWQACFNLSSAGEQKSGAGHAFLLNTPDTCKTRSPRNPNDAVTQWHGRNIHQARHSHLYLYN